MARDIDLLTLSNYLMQLGNLGSPKSARQVGSPEMDGESKFAVQV